MLQNLTETVQYYLLISIHWLVLRKPIVLDLVSSLGDNLMILHQNNINYSEILITQIYGNFQW